MMGVTLAVILFSVLLLMGAGGLLWEIMRDEYGRVLPEPMEDE